MDPLTHALSGAVAGRIIVTETEPIKNRIARLAVLMGAVFPDCDVVLNLFEPHSLGTIRFHRGVTHSFVCLPVFAATLAALAAWFCSRMRIACPGWARLSALFGLGIGLHIAFDLITSFGTMAWSPLSWKRVSWDTTFIIDPALTGILLLPLLLLWIYSRRENAARRAVAVWISASIAAVAAVAVGETIRELATGIPATGWGLFNNPFALWTILGISAIVAVVASAPLVGNMGFQISARQWCAAGLALAFAYLGCCAAAHAAAISRVESFADSRGLQVQKLGALPMPPSLLYWSGLVSTRERIYYAYFSLLDSVPPQFAEYTQAPSDQFTEEASAQPAGRIVLAFFRFPLIVERAEAGGGEHDVEFFDLRFLPRRGGALSFSYRIKLDDAGRIVSEGWIRGAR